MSAAWMRAGVPALLLCLAVASPLGWNWRHNDRSEYFYTRDFAQNILHTMEPNAIYFPSADHATFPVMYLQAVEGIRPDVTIANKYGYPEVSLYRDMPDRASINAIPNAQDERRIENWVIQHSGRPVYFSARRSMEGLSGHELRETGLLFRVMRAEENLPERDLWNEYAWTSLDESTTAGELTADYVLSDVLYMQGRAALAKDDHETALGLFDKVARINPDNKETLNNLGSACAETGQLDAALSYLDLALKVDSSYGTALVNSAKVHCERGEYPKALLRLEAVLKADDKNSEAVRLSATSLVAIRWYDEAIARYEYLATLTPSDPAVCKSLGDLYLDHKNDRAAARQYYAMSLQLDGSQAELKQKLDELSAPEMPELPELPQAPATPGIQDPLSNVPGLPTLPDSASPGIPSLPAVP